MINKNIAWRSALVTFLSLSLSVLLPCSQAEAVDEGDSATGQKLPPEDALQVKLRTLVLPRLDLRDAALEEVVGFLRLRSRELDPEGQGVNFVITSAAMQAAQDAQITIQLSDVPLGTALEYVTSMAGVSLRVDKNAVVLTDKQPALQPQLQKITELEKAQTPENGLQSKLNTIVISQLNFRDAALEEVVNFLRLRSRELDPEGQGVNFVITSAAMQAAQDAKITLQLSDVPLGTALEYVTSMAGVSLRVDENAVVLDVRR